MNWNEMTARERDAVVATRVMRWMACDRKAMGWGDGPEVWLTGDESSPTYQGFNPSGKIDHAWLVVERMREKGFQLQLFAPITNGQWTAKFMCHKSGKLHFGFGPTAPEAICLVAIRAEGVEV